MAHFKDDASSGLSVKSGIGMFNDTLLAELLDHPVGLEADLTLLDVELSKTSTIPGHGLHASIRDHLTTSQRQLPQ